jgi:hypothetical protein
MIAYQKGLISSTGPSFPILSTLFILIENYRDFNLSPLQPVPEDAKIPNFQLYILQQYR